MHLVILTVPDGSLQSSLGVNATETAPFRRDAAQPVPASAGRRHVHAGRPT